MVVGILLVFLIGAVVGIAVFPSLKRPCPRRSHAFAVLVTGAILGEIVRALGLALAQQVRS